MSHRTATTDRRRHYRISCALRRQPTAHMFVNDARVPSVTPLNFSAGGMLCAVELGDLALRPQQRIDCIQLVFPRKAPLAFSGRVVRMKDRGQANGYLCAVRFETVLSSDDVPGMHLDWTDLAQRIKAGELSDALIQRLRLLPNYMQIDDPHKAAGIREQVYASFRSVLKALEPRERWWFCEVLDALKSMEPRYSFGLLDEYVRLCKKAYSAAYRKLMEERYSDQRRIDYQIENDC